MPVERLRIVAEPLAEDALLQHQARLRKALAHDLAGAEVCSLGLFVAPRELADVAEHLGDPRDVVRRQLQVVGGRERALEQLGRNHVCRIGAWPAPRP